MSVSPTSNIINERATYSFQFKTATTGTIKTIEISFPSSFDVSGIRLVEREGISSGTLSFSGSTIKYTIGSAESIPAGTYIRFEIARIIATAEGSFTVSIKTLNSQGGTIDGPTTSGPFIIKSIDSNDISPSFMIKKTLNDDPAGNARGWNPNGASTTFQITDPDIGGDFLQNEIMININVDTHLLQFPATCSINNIFTPFQFGIACTNLIPNQATLQYTVTKLPANVVTSSQSVSESAPLSSSSMFSESINRQDETSSQFPSSLFTSSQDIGSTNTQDGTSSELP